MKILQIYKGKDKSADADRRLLKRNGHRVTYFEKNTREMNKYSLVNTPYLGGPNYQSNENNLQMRALIQKNRPNVVHFYNTIFTNSTDLYEICRKLGIVVIQSLNNYELLCPKSTMFYSNKLCKLCVQKSLLKENGQQKCFRDNQIESTELNRMMGEFWTQKGTKGRVDCYLVKTDFFKQKLISYGLPDNKIAVKPDYSEEPFSEKGDEKEYFLFIGKLTEESGIKTLLKAWSLLSSDIPLRILGDGQLKQAVLDTCSANSSVEFLGWQTKADCSRHLAQASMLIYPAESCDSFPTVIARSYSFGIPVIACNHGGMDQIVLDGISGCLFPPGDFEALAEKIRWLSENSDTLQSMKEKAKIEYETKYTDKKNYEILINLYQEAIAQKKRFKDRGGNRFNNSIASRFLIRN